MIYKKSAMLLALIGACQVQAAAHAGKVAKAASAVAGIGAVTTLGSLLVYKKNTSKLLADPNSKRAFEMLNNKEDCKITFGFYDYPAGDIRKCESADLTPREAYEFTWILSHNYGDGAVENLRVCSGDSCVDVSSITRRVQIAPFTNP